MIISFQDLSSFIIKCCKASTPEDPSDYAAKHAFSIDMNKMETIFRGNKLDYHIIACTTNLSSYVPYMNDVHNLAQYAKDSDELDNIMNGLTQIAIFSLYCDQTKDGPIAFRLDKDNDNTLSNKELFDVCNKEDKINVGLITQIVKGTPSYSILVYRQFSQKRDRFVYNVRYIANKEMNQYYRSVEDTLKKQ